MRVRVYVVLFCLLGLSFLASCRGGETPIILTPTSTRTPIYSTPSPSPLATDTPYPTDTPSPRPPTNTLSATLTQSWPQTPTPVPTITRTPTQTLTWTPSPTVTGTPSTATPTPTVTQSSTPTPSATMSDQPLVWVSPPLQTAQPGGSSSQVEIRLSNFTDVYDMDLLLSYNKDLITIIDANPSLAGIQVLTGTCPKPDLVLLNRVDAINGTIDYRVTQLDPTLPCEDGIVVTIEFACIASGTDNLLFDSTLVIDVNGAELVHNVENGTIVCQP